MDDSTEGRLQTLMANLEHAILDRSLPDGRNDAVLQFAVEKAREDLLSLARSGMEANAKMREALHPFAEYATCRDAKPLLGLDDVIHAIHYGTQWQSEIRLSDCRKAAKLLGYAVENPSPEGQ